MAFTHFPQPHDLPAVDCEPDRDQPAGTGWCTFLWHQFVCGAFTCLTRLPERHGKGAFEQHAFWHCDLGGCP